MFIVPLVAPIRNQVLLLDELNQKMSKNGAFDILGGALLGLGIQELLFRRFSSETEHRNMYRLIAMVSGAASRLLIRNIKSEPSR